MVANLLQKLHPISLSVLVDAQVDDISVDANKFPLWYDPYQSALPNLVVCPSHHKVMSLDAGKIEAQEDASRSQ